MRRLKWILLLQIPLILLYGQEAGKLHPPLKIPMLLSGNFGELRDDHFHSGIDIKTGGKIGQHIFAINDGYVSRIKIQANGYGKSLYLAHPDGTTSVYGHLDAFRKDIAAYTKDLQYEKKKHEVNIYPGADEFLVQKGEFIAYSGNTGGSFGPHLHFEIRKTESQHPVNVLKYDLPIKDEIPPRFFSLSLSPLDERSHVNGSREMQIFELTKEQGLFLPERSPRAGGRIGLGVEVYDYLDGSHNRCGIYTLEVYVNDRLTYSQVMDEFSFSESRYINAHIEYGEKIRSGKRIQRLYRLSNDRLSIYGHMEDDGILAVAPDMRIPVRVIATDVEGNRSELHFNISGSLAPYYYPEYDSEAIRQELKAGKEEKFRHDKLELKIPSDALYEDLLFSYAESLPRNGSLSPSHHIHNSRTPVHKAMQLSILVPEKDTAFYSKLLIMEWDDKNEEWMPAGGSWREGRVVSDIRRFGTYAIGLDTIPPELSLLGKTDAGEAVDILKFRVTDTGSGIESYEGYIDQEWALFEYDPKNDLLSYTPDKNKITKGVQHLLELHISDTRGNVRLYTESFYW